MKNQLIHLRCALYDQGDYKICNEMASHIVDDDSWHEMQQAEKDRRFERF